MEQSACVYELEQPRPSAKFDHQPTETSTNTHPDASLTARSTENGDSNHLGYADVANGTVGIIRSLAEGIHSRNISRSRQDSMADQYVSIIRELPSPRHIDFLVQAFFQNVAWHYDMVDEAAFTAQLSQWSSISHHQLKLAPDSLPASLQAFPALLFQVLAQALLFQPTRHDIRLNDLKYAADMDLSDRAADYSNAGQRIAALFRKSDITLTIVQAELMRACFEKTSGAVTEAWHTLGTAIRDAQELGLHKLDPDQHSPWRAETSHGDLGRKLWLILHLWDTHMAIVLGRPMSTRLNPDVVPRPTRWDCTSDPPRVPSPRDVILYGYHAAYKYLQDIYDLEKEDDCILTVQQINESLVANIAEFSTWAQTQRSPRLEPTWLTAALEVMHTNIHFVLFALHRPFIFAESSSRVAACNAATQILESQARLFDDSEPLQHRAFSWVYSTFDAVVLIIAVHIRFPEEFVGQLPTTTSNLESALERLRVISKSNRLAASALLIVQRLYERMMAVFADPTQTMMSFSARSSDSFTGMEAEQWANGWDDGSLLSTLGNYTLPPEPLNDLLNHGSSGFDPAWSTEPDCGLHQPQTRDLVGLR